MTVGSRWYKFDFHNHTPASDDYAIPGLSDREWLLAYMRKQVDCVVISDHNSGARIDPLKTELQRMSIEAQNGAIEGYRPLTLFPGVELTATGNVHILAVFHTERGSADVERLIGQCSNSPHRREQPNHQLVLQLGSAGIISQIRLNPEALCILAHIDAPKGILTMTNQEELEAAFHAQPHAVEIRYNLSDITDGTHLRLIGSLPKLRGSDAHHPDHAGSRSCWVKMSRPDFDGLRHALLDHDNCILFDTPPPEEPALQLRSLKLRTRLCCPVDGGTANVEFSPFYNAVIGSRGSGKSTLIESVRLAMRKTSGLSASQKGVLDAFSKVGEGMAADSVIECIYRKDGTDFRLSWRPEHVHQLHNWTDGEWQEDAHWSADRFPVSVFSQKMLYKLASDNESFLRVCDESSEVNKRAWSERWGQLERDFKNEQTTLRGYLASQQSESSLKGELADAERAVSQLSESDYYPVRQRLATAEQELSEATAALQRFEDHISSVEAQSGTAAEDEHPDSNPSVSLKEISALISSAQQSFEHGIRALLNSAGAAVRGIRDGEHLAALHAVVLSERKNVDREAASLREKGLNPDTLDQLMERCERLRSSLKEYAGLEDATAESQERINSLLNEMRQHRKALTESRRQFLSSLELQELEIKVLPLCASSDIAVSGYQKATGITSFSERIYDSEAQSGLLKEFIAHRPFRPVPADTDAKYALLDKVKKLHFDLKHNESAAVHDLHGAFANRIRGISDEALDSLMCWYPDDGIYIKYRAPSGNMEDITSASPGQKGASMLQFLLSYGTDPLILDQPEDDLDCLMLSQSVIPAIAANKKRRQLVIVSHSAPIVVNGDAEYVISMKHDRAGLSPSLCGALQEKEMKELICRQMEGGEKAFRSRYERILS